MMAARVEVGGQEEEEVEGEGEGEEGATTEGVQTCMSARPWEVEVVVTVTTLVKCMAATNRAGMGLTHTTWAQATRWATTGALLLPHTPKAMVAAMTTMVACTRELLPWVHTARVPQATGPSEPMAHRETKTVEA